MEPPSFDTATAIVEEVMSEVLPSATSSVVQDNLRLKRKARSQKVCQPCRLRKVKCTYEQPCLICVQRGHPELCSYPLDHPAKRVHAKLGSLSDSEAETAEKNLINMTSSKDDVFPTAPIETILRELREVAYQIRNDVYQLRGDNYHSVLRAERSGISQEPLSESGISAEDNPTRNPVYIGAHSVPAMVVALTTEDNGHNTTKEILGKSMLPVFGLDNESVTYPFVDLWGIPHGSLKRIDLLCNLLPPTDAEIMQTFKQYKDTSHVIYPGIVDIAQFECDLLDFLRSRSLAKTNGQPHSPMGNNIYGKDLHWIGLLFSAMASGVQCMDIAWEERQTKSQVYGR